MTVTVSTDKFTYDAKSKTFVAEISEARENFGYGFYLRSEKTGVKKLFHHYKSDTDGEDIYGWWYYTPGERYKVLIIND